MNNRELERRIHAAADHAAPDVFPQVLVSLDRQKGCVNSMNEKTTAQLVPAAAKKNRWPAVAAAAALLLLICVGGVGWNVWQAGSVASIVSLDVNPSIELKVNARQKVLACTPLNADAAQVLFEMDGGADLEGSKLDVAVNAIVGALVRHGYLDRISSALLISVEDSDQARADRIQQELTGSVTTLLQQQLGEVSVYGQTMTQDAGLDRLASDHHISTGKAALANQVLAVNGTLPFETLSALSVEELSQMIAAGAPALPIGLSQARAAAEEYAGTLAMNSVTADVGPELDETPPHYEVELHTPFGEFEYQVDAYSGKILSGQPNLVDGGSSDEVQPSQPPAPVSPESSQPPAQTSPQPAPSTAPAEIGLDAAKAAALSHAGLTQAQTTGLKAEPDWEDGQLAYEVEFWSGSTEYEYVIDGYTGAVLKYEQEDHTAASPSQGTYIGEESARNYAFAHAGCAAGDASSVTCRLDRDDLCYEVEFWVGNNCYEYEIDCYSGSVLKHQCENHSFGHHGGVHH